METYAEMVGEYTIQRIEKWGHYDDFVDPETASVRDLNIASHAVWGIAVALYELLPTRKMECGCTYRPGFGGELSQDSSMMCPKHLEEFNSEPW